MKKSVLTLICLFLLISCSKDVKKGQSASFLKTDEIVTKQKELLDVPGIAVGLIINNKVVYKGAKGFQSLDTREPLTTKSVFHMASVSKPFVATAIIQLVEKGKIELDEKLTHYLPYFTMADENYKNITIRQMLSHTSGIPDIDDYEWDKPQYDDGAAERFTRSQKSIKLDFKPGEKFNYSNPAFDILCDVISKVSGLTFEEYMKQNIFKPIGMKHSTFLKKEVQTELATMPHVMGDSLQKVVSKIYPYNRIHAGSSTLHSNVEDMLLWAKVNLNKGIIDGNRIYNEDSYKILTTIQTRENQRKVGLSWFIGEFKDFDFIYHSGGDTGYSTFFGFIPEKKVAITLMINTDNFRTWENSIAILKNTVFNDSIEIKAPIHFKLKDYILSDGIEKVKEIYFTEKEKPNSQYSFNGGNLDDLGYYLLEGKYYEKALDVFRFNIELEPNHSGWPDSVGDAYKEMDSIDLAIKWYKKALEMKPEQNFSKIKLNELIEKKNQFILENK